MESQTASVGHPAEICLAEPLLPRRYRIVPHERIARVLLEAAVKAPRGKHIIESASITDRTG